MFKSYVEKVYNIKSNPINKTQKSMAKSLLNNLLGRFGIKLDKAVTKLVTKKIFDRISVMHRVVSYLIIGEHKVLISYLPHLNNYHFIVFFREYPIRTDAILKT